MSLHIVILLKQLFAKRNALKYYRPIHCWR